MAATGVPPPPSIDPIQAIAEFKDAILEAGLVLRGDPMMDGKIHRVPVQGARSKGNQSGRYVGYLDEHPAGKIWNYKEGTETGWRASRPTRSLSEAQRKQREERIKREQDAREAERLQTEKRIAQWADRVWQSATPVEFHPYLTRKGVAAHSLRVDKRNRLLVPMRDISGNIHSIQSISEDGEKHFTKGGRQIGTHYLVGSPQSNEPLIFAEGYATAATIHQAVRLPVVVCFNSGNFLPVVQDYRRQYPDRKLIIAADNDQHLVAQSKPNVGIEKAMKAAESVSAHAVLVPPFPPSSNGTDWNDYHAQRGIEAVRNLIHQQMGMTKEINVSETNNVQEYEQAAEQVKSQAERSIQSSPGEHETTRLPMTDLEAKVLEAYQQNTSENWRSLRSVGFGTANVDQIWKTGGEPNLQMKEGGIYRLVLDSSGFKGYVVPDPNLEMRANYVRSEGFGFLFQGYEPTTDASVRLQLLQAATVEKQGDRWVVTQKGEVQSKTLEQQTEREPNPVTPVSQEPPPAHRISARPSTQKEPGREDLRIHQSSWHDEQAAKEKAIELVNQLEGGPEQNQQRLSQTYDTLKQLHPNWSGNAVWEEAAKAVSKESSREQQGVTASQEIRTGPERNMSSWQGSAKLLDHGAAPYQFDPHNEQSYFMKLGEPDGTERFRWGKELPAAIEKAGAQIGDFVAVERTGQVPVVVPVPIKDATGKVLRTEAIDTHRNEWQIDVVTRPEHSVADRDTANHITAAAPRTASQPTPQDRSEDRTSFQKQSQAAQAPFFTARGAAAATPGPALERLTRAQVEQAIAVRADLQDKDLSGLDLSHLTFRHMNLSGSSLANVTARNVVIEDCFALGTDFTRAQFDDSSIRNLNASGSCWNRAELHATPIESAIFDSAVTHDLLISGESRIPQQKRTDPPRMPTTLSKIRVRAGELLENLSRPPSLREDLQALFEATRRGWNAMTRSGQQTRSEAETAVRLPAELSQEKRPVEIAHNSFVKADLTGARFVGVSFYQNNFDGAILRDVIGLAHAVDVTKQLERDSKRTQELADLREEGLERLGCKDQNVNREKAAKLTEALDRKLSEGIEKGLDLTPRRILDNAIRSVLNENANPVNKNREKEQEQERIHTRARTSRGR